MTDKTYARVVGGVVVNVEVWGEEPPALAGVALVETSSAARGDLWDGEEFTRPEPGSFAPAEVAMHKVEKAALLMPWPGFDNLAAAIEDGISRLPAPSNALAMIEWKRAPNLQREGLTTIAVMGLIGMTPEQRDDLLNFAATLP